MTRIVLFLSLSVSMIGCASISGMVKNHMAKQVRLQEAVKTQVYELSVADLKLKVEDYFTGWRSITPDKRRQRIKDDIDKGFVYQGKYYQKYEPGLMDVFNTLSTGDKEYISDFFTQTSYHKIKDDLDGFKFVFDGMIFEAKRVTDKTTKLEVYSFNDIEHGPYKLDVNFMAFVSKMGSLFTLRKGAVLLEDSMAYASRDMMTEIELFKKINPKKYEQISSM